MEVLIKLIWQKEADQNMPLPSYQTIGSSGADVRANLGASGATLDILPGERKLIPTGFCLEIPENYEIQIRPRSGLALKYGITVLNSPGTIDSDYRGEIKVIIYNHGKENFVVNNKDRIAQMILTPVIKMELQEIDVLPETVRGEDGFGSTGK